MPRFVEMPVSQRAASLEDFLKTLYSLLGRHAEVCGREFRAVEVMCGGI